jgi:hypothetical protein
MDCPLVNRTEEAVPVDFAELVAPAVDATGSPIDEYYQHTRALLTPALKAFSNPDPVLLQALFLGVVSAAEFFYRDLLSRLIGICPLARRSAAPRTLSLGAVSYCGSRLGLGVLENTSFADPDEIRKWTNSILGMEIKNGSSVESALDEYGRACQVRHAATHSRGYLGAQNVRKLELESSALQVLHLDIIGFQQLLAACHNAVRAYNRYVFEGTVQRWIDRGILLGNWQHDKASWTSLFDVSYSWVDSTGTQVAYQAWRRIREYAESSARAQGFL